MTEWRQCAVGFLDANNIVLLNWRVIRDSWQSRRGADYNQLLSLEANRYVSKNPACLRTFL